MSNRPVPARIVALAMAIAVTSLTTTVLVAFEAGARVGAVQAGAAGPATSTRHPVIPASPRHANGRTGEQNSLNWAGYAVTGTTFSSVSATWVVPTASCTKNATQLDSTWVGLDGFAASDPTVEQIGTDSDCVKTRGRHSGTPIYYAWLEMFPKPTQLLPLSIYPGEVISGSVTVSGSTYTLTLTNGVWTYPVSFTPAGPFQNSSAEWITEAPTRCSVSGACSIVPLADFGQIVFSGALANGQPISSHSFTSTEIDIANRSGKKVRARTSNLSLDGSAFTITWLHK
jgi:hypothetical protein